MRVPSSAAWRLMVLAVVMTGAAGQAQIQPDTRRPGIEFMHRLVTELAVK